MIEFRELRKTLPQAYPFLMIDRVLEFKEGESLVAVKNITSNEWSSLGIEGEVHHFPETLIIEAAAQAAIIFGSGGKNQKDKKLPAFILGKVAANFFKPAVAGDQLNIQLEARKLLQTGAVVSTNVSVSGEKVAEIEMFFSVKGK